MQRDAAWWWTKGRFYITVSIVIIFIFTWTTRYIIENYTS